MFNLIRADLFKLRKSWSLKVLLCISSLCAIFMLTFAYWIPQGKIDASMTGIGFMFSDPNIISILGGVLAGILICGDLDHKLIHEAVSGGFSRSRIIVSKAIVLAIAILLILMPYAIITGIGLISGNAYDMGNVAVGFLHLLTTESGTALTGMDMLHLLAVMLILILVYIAQLSICIPLAFLLRKPVLVIAIYYGFSILTAQLIGLSWQFEVFDRIFSLTPYGGHHAFLTLATNAGDLLQTLIVSLVFTALMIGISYLFFRKSELK